jgi:hypothetical protein
MKPEHLRTIFTRQSHFRVRVDILNIYFAISEEDEIALMAWLSARGQYILLLLS